jgi:hypothetical protein
MVGPGIVGYLQMDPSTNHIYSPRFTSHDTVNNSTIHLQVQWDTSGWLSQANHIFSRLRVSSNFDDYGGSFTTSWSAAHMNLRGQLYWMGFPLRSPFSEGQQTHHKAFYFWPHPKNSNPGRHLNGQTALPIGPLIQQVLNSSVRKTQTTSDFPLWDCSRPSWEDHGMPLFTTDSGSFTGSKVSIQIARKSPSI